MMENNDRLTMDISNPGIQSTNRDDADPSCTFDTELYHYFVNDRINLAKFLSNNCDLLEYDTIRLALARICKKNKISLTDLMIGNIGGQHNSRMSVSIFPTINLFRMLSIIMNKLGIQKLEDIGSGVGLVPHVFKTFNALIHNHINTNSQQKNKPTGQTLMSNLISMIRSTPRSLNNSSMASSSSSRSIDRLTDDLYKNIVPLESIIASDPKYSLSTAITMNDVTMFNRDHTDYIVDTDGAGTYDPETAYLIMDPYISQDMQTMDETIVNFVMTRRPKLFIIMGNHQTNYENSFDSYNCHKLIPKTFCFVDSAAYNLMSRTTHYKMYIFVRSDINVNLDQQITEIKRDVLEEIKDPSFDAVALMTEHDKLPQSILADNKKVASILREMYMLKINTLPLHLENITEIESYLNLYKTAYNDMHRHPDILQIRDNFLKVNEYLDLVYTDLDKLKLSGVVPKHLTIDNAISFILRDYAFSDKKITNVHNRYISMTRR
jgi:hypothetical protein